MSLSEHERHLLGDIERRLTDDDPVLARDLGAPLPERRRCGVVIGAVMLIGGIALLILGSFLAWTPVLIIGLFSSMLFPVPLQLDLHRRDRGRS